MTAVRVSAPAKVNLRLRVLAVETSGYHQLETLYQALDFGDDVEVQPIGTGVQLHVDGPVPCPAEENLAYRAAAAYLDHGRIDQGVRIHLKKRIPAGAGLGGGSSDAAAVLKALDALYEGELAAPALAALARGLGADVPFFLSPSPLALAWGRGDRFLPLTPLPAASVLVCVPPFGVATPEAFHWLDGHRDGQVREPPTGLLDTGSLTSWEGIAPLAVNDFHDPVFGAHPELRRLFEDLQATGPDLCLLSGSGASLFGLYTTPGRRDAAVSELSTLDAAVRLVPTVTRTAMP